MIVGRAVPAARCRTEEILVLLRAQRGAEVRLNVGEGAFLQGSIAESEAAPACASDAGDAELAASLDFALEHPVKFRSASTSAVEPNVRPCRAMYSMTNLLIERELLPGS
jgi:hypothetical protein